MKKLNSLLSVITLLGGIGAIVLGVILRQIDNPLLPVCVIGSVGSMILQAILTIAGLGQTRIKNGKPGVGIIQQARQTGTYINQQPQIEFVLQISSREGEQFTGNVSAIIPMTQLAAFQVGGVVPVLIGDNQRVAFPRQGDPQLSQTELQELYQTLLVKNGTVSAESVEIARRGITTYATVKGMKPLSQLSDPQVEVELELEVTLKDKSVTSVTVIKKFPREVIEQVQPGRVVEVIYLAEDVRKLVIRTKSDQNVMASAFGG